MFAIRCQGVDWIYPSLYIYHNHYCQVRSRSYLVYISFWSVILWTIMGHPSFKQHLESTPDDGCCCGCGTCTIKDTITSAHVAPSMCSITPKIYHWTERLPGNLWPVLFQENPNIIWNMLIPNKIIWDRNT